VDIKQLSVLTNLTKLAVNGPADLGLDDAAAVALAGSLTRLQELALGSSSSKLTWSVLPALARLTDLRDLRLRFSSC
jgi:hypothetical protein